MAIQVNDDDDDNDDDELFCGMVDRRKVFSLSSSRDHCQRSSPSWISDTPWARFEPVQNLSSGLVEWICILITMTPRRHWIISVLEIFRVLLMNGCINHAVANFANIDKTNGNFVWTPIFNMSIFGGCKPDPDCHLQCWF